MPEIWGSKFMFHETWKTGPKQMIRQHKDTGTIKGKKTWERCKTYDAVKKKMLKLGKLGTSEKGSGCLLAS
jgi:hypothetical protein